MKTTVLITFLGALLLLSGCSGATPLTELTLLLRAFLALGLCGIVSAAARHRYVRGIEPPTERIYHAATH